MAGSMRRCYKQGTCTWMERVDQHARRSRRAVVAASLARFNAEVLRVPELVRSRSSGLFRTPLENGIRMKVRRPRQRRDQLL